MRLLNIFGVFSGHLFRNCVGRLTIITSIFCVASNNEFSSYCTFLVMTNISIFLDR